MFRSNYNYFVARDDGIVCYNSKSGVFALLDDETGSKLQCNEPLGGIKDYKDLLSMGFLHEGDEKEEIKEKFIKRKGRKSTLSITIMPAMGCNFSCPYCYQKKGNSKFMNKETQKAVLKFIDDQIHEYDAISLTWYGGEPLLKPDIVVSLAKNINDIASSNKVKVKRHSMVSNGILLDKSTVSELSKVGLHHIQISIDSLVYKSPSARGVIDDKGNPSILLKNILLAKEYINIKLRVNVHKENRDELGSIINVLKKYNLDKFITLARVTSDSSFSGLVSSNNSMAVKDYSLLEQYTSNKSVASLINKLRPRDSFCSSPTGSMFVIDADGNLYRCWRNADDPKYSVGTVFDGTKDTCTEKKWKLYQPLDCAECLNCKVAPLCMGGCAHSGLFLTKGFKAQCDPIRYQIDGVLNKVVEALELPAL